ncbi:MAG: Cof-type HAD-IIB family hydrolase [Clostridiaceae bacterium]
MGNYKMICLDIDGTLLNSQHMITEKTKEAVSLAANEKAIPVILVSARMPKGILFLQEELGITQPIICYSGSMIMDKDGSILLKKAIQVSSTKKICEAAKTSKLHVSLYKDDEWYIEALDPWAQQESDITGITPVVTRFEKLFESWEKEGTGPNKILIMAEPHEITLLKENLTDDSLNIYRSKTTYLEIMSKEASKTSAIDFLRKRFDVQVPEIIAMGDNYNDIDMIEYAGRGIAMGNAPDDVKIHADEVTLSNDEDGVSAAIIKHVLF